MSSVYTVLWYICQEQLLAFSESRKLNGGTKRFPVSVNNLYYSSTFCKCPLFSFLLPLFTSLPFFVLCTQLKYNDSQNDSFPFISFPTALVSFDVGFSRQSLNIHLGMGFYHPKQPGPSMSATKSMSQLCLTPIHAGRREEFYDQGAIRISSERTHLTLLGSCFTSSDGFNILGGRKASKVLPPGARNKCLEQVVLHHMTIPLEK